MVYDLNASIPIRSIHVAGTLEFARDRDTRLDVGLIKVQPGDDASENGFDCDAHPAADAGPARPRPALLVGLPDDPVPAGKTALIRLKHVDGLDPETCPAIISCGGRMEFHGAPMNRTWTKLAREAFRNEAIILLKQEEIAAWKPGDHLILTGTTRQFGYKQTRTVSVVERPATEERTLKAIKPYVEHGLALVTLDRPLENDHRAIGNYRAEVANLTRNVIVESADPDGIRGHTMYHKNSSGAISYAEFRHLGKEGVLGKYSLHFHLAGTSMRGGSVVGASIWDSNNRWITIHGTSYLVIRDCVGYKSIGHGYFLEDGTETRNVLDHNLAVMALRGQPLPNQVLPYDKNLGSGFWWANSLNTFTDNVAVECDQDGFRFEVFAGDGFNPKLPVLQPDGSRKSVNVRTLPFIRFDRNETHCQRFFGLNLGGFTDGGVPGYPGSEGKRIQDVDGIGPDTSHPFIIRDFRAWDCHWPFHGDPIGASRGPRPVRLAIRRLADGDRPPRICGCEDGPDHLDGRLLPPPGPGQARRDRLLEAGGRLAAVDRDHPGPPERLGRPADRRRGVVRRRRNPEGARQRPPGPPLTPELRRVGGRDRRRHRRRPQDHRLCRRCGGERREDAASTRSSADRRDRLPCTCPLSLRQETGPASRMSI